MYRFAAALPFTNRFPFLDPPDLFPEADRFREEAVRDDPLVRFRRRGRDPEEPDDLRAEERHTFWAAGVCSFTPCWIGIWCFLSHDGEVSPERIYLLPRGCALAHRA